MLWVALGLNAAMFLIELAAVALFRFRGGEANLRSAWLSGRNDAIGDVAVILSVP